MSKTTWNLPKYPQNLKNEQSTCETSKLAKTPKNQQNDKKKKKKKPKPLKWIVLPWPQYLKQPKHSLISKMVKKSPKT